MVKSIEIFMYVVHFIRHSLDYREGKIAPQH